MTEETAESFIPQHMIAFIIDNKVEEVIGIDDRLAAVLLSSPTIVDVTGIPVTTGHIYNPEDGTFSSVIG
jgi:hypothetical protein